MKAALFYGKKEDIRIESIAIPKINSGEVLLKINTCGICGSDARSYFNGIEERYKIPIILGHELTATVYKVGEDLKGYEPGDRVVLAPIYGCGQCELCLSGKENLCKDVVVFGCNYDGGFAEYMRIPKKGVERGVLVKISDDLTDAAGTMVEPFSCCLHGLRQLQIQPGDSVAIFGSGPIGLAHMILSKTFGAGRIIVIDMVDARLEQAKTFGANFTININQKDWKKVIFENIGNGGADIVVTAAPSITAIKSGLEIIKHGGKLLIFGGLPHGSVLSIDPNMIHYNEITVYGSIDATIDDFRRTASITPQLGLDRFITYSFLLEEIKDGMEVIRSKKGLKVIIDMKK